MRWVVEYYEQADTTQPAEVFETSLKREHKKLGAKLRAIAAAIEEYGPQLGGGLIEPCHDYKACGRYARFLMAFSAESFSVSMESIRESFSCMAMSSEQVNRLQYPILTRLLIIGRITSERIR